MYLLLKRLIKIEGIIYSTVIFFIVEPLICLPRINTSNISVGTSDTYRIVSDQTECRPSNYDIFTFLVNVDRLVVSHQSRSIFNMPVLFHLHTTKIKSFSEHFVQEKHILTVSQLRHRVSLVRVP